MTLALSDLKFLLWSVLLLSSYTIVAQEVEEDIIVEYKIIDRFESPIPSINYLTETAFGLRKGEIYYQNILLFGQKFGIGISDHFSINTGFELYSMFDGRAPSILIAPKFTFNEREAPVKFGVGSNFVLVSTSGSNQVAGSFYGLATFGNTDNHLTLGVGMGYDSYGLYGVPVFQVSGQLRLSDHFALVLDTLTLYYDSDYGSANSFFFRYMNKDFIIDLGGLVSLTGPEAIPLANFAVRLN